MARCISSKLKDALRNAINRCNDVSHPSYPRYGGKGIYVCDEWVSDPQTFVKWAMSNGYKLGMSIDRIDSNNGYSPNNCRIIDNRLNSAITSRRVMTQNMADQIDLLRADGMSQRRIAEKLGVSRQPIQRYLEGKYYIIEVH